MSHRPILTAVDIWRRYDAAEVRLSAPLTDRMLELAGVREQMRVLDLATGRGEPALSAARRVGPGGTVLGVDISAEMLAMARGRAMAEGLTNLELRECDAATVEDLPDDHFDVTLVRWGLMFMDAPVRALVNARRAMRAGGLLVAAVWAEPDRVPYWSLPRRVLEKYRRLPPVDFEAPGVFHYADPERLRRDLEQAGFRLDLVEELNVQVMEAATSEELIEWARAFGLTRLLNDLPEEAQRAWERDFAAEGESLRRNDRDGDGVIQMGGVTRIFVARPFP